MILFSLINHSKIQQVTIINFYSTVKLTGIYKNIFTVTGEKHAKYC